MEDRPKAIVGLGAIVRVPDVEPQYFTDTHRRHVGAAGIVHAVVPAGPRDNPLVKVKFPPDDRIVFFRLADLEIRDPDGPVRHEKHGKRASHLPDRSA